MATDTTSSEFELIRAEHRNSKNIVLSHTDTHQCVLSQKYIFMPTFYCQTDRQLQRCEAFEERTIMSLSLQFYLTAPD